MNSVTVTEVLFCIACGRLYMTSPEYKLQIIFVLITMFCIREFNIILHEFENVNFILKMMVIQNINKPDDAWEWRVSGEWRAESGEPILFAV